jgi:hypothetical protein
MTVESSKSHFSCDNSMHSDQTRPGKLAGWVIGWQCTVLVSINPGNGVFKMLMAVRCARCSAILQRWHLLVMQSRPVLHLFFLPCFSWDIFFANVGSLVSILQYSRMMTGRVIMQVKTWTYIEELLLWIKLLLHHKAEIVHSVIEHILVSCFQLRVLVSLDMQSIDWDVQEYTASIP